MGKKKTAGQKAAENRSKAPRTVADVDMLLATALARLHSDPPNLVFAKVAITNSRKALRQACALPPLK